MAVSFEEKKVYVDKVLAYAASHDISERKACLALDVSRDKYKHYKEEIYPEGKSILEATATQPLEKFGDGEINLKTTEGPIKIQVREMELPKPAKDNHKKYERHERIQVPVNLSVLAFFEEKKDETMVPVSLQCAKILADYVSLVENGTIKDSLKELM